MKLRRLFCYSLWQTWVMKKSTRKRSGERQLMSLGILSLLLQLKNGIRSVTRPRIDPIVLTSLKKQDSKEKRKKRGNVKPKGLNVEDSLKFNKRKRENLSKRSN